MKTTTLIATLLLSLTSYAQTVNGVPIKELNVEYAQIVGTGKFASNKVSIEIDFGQENKIFKSSDTQLRDSTDKKVTFNSMIDAMNFMSSVGYYFKAAYAYRVASLGADYTVYHFLLQRKPKDEK